MAPWRIITASLLICTISSSREQDIYHVITGEPEIPYKRSLDPVYYVGVYDQKPPTMPREVNPYTPINKSLHNHFKISMKLR